MMVDRASLLLCNRLLPHLATFSGDLWARNLGRTQECSSHLGSLMQLQPDIDQGCCPPKAPCAGGWGGLVLPIGCEPGRDSCREHQQVTPHDGRLCRAGCHHAASPRGASILRKPHRGVHSLLCALRKSCSFMSIIAVVEAITHTTRKGIDTTPHWKKGQRMWRHFSTVLVTSQIQ